MSQKSKYLLLLLLIVLCVLPISILAENESTPINQLPVTNEDTVATDGEIILYARVYGKIYDANLKRMNDLIVEIDSEPEQRFVSKDGTYSFEVPVGHYTLSVHALVNNSVIYYVKENVSLPTVGTFIKDLYSREFIVAQEPPPTKPPEKRTFLQRVTQSTLSITISIAAIIVILTILIFGYRYLLFRKKIEGEIKEVKEDNIKLREEGIKKELEEKIRKQKLRPELQQVVDIIIKQDRRTTQKEIRKEIPLSEAKISLMISELVELGVIKKIKKGRGNIIILEKNT